MPVVIVYVSTPKAPRYLCSCKFTIDRRVDFLLIARNEEKQQKKNYMKDMFVPQP
jgi:hypothetical protein